MNNIEKYDGETVKYWEQNAEEDYIKTPISVLKYINVLEKEMEQLTNRYIEAERFISELNWFEKLFISRKVKNFLKSRLEKYNF